jgi:hypothetical protein
VQGGLEAEGRKVAYCIGVRRWPLGRQSREQTEVRSEEGRVPAKSAEGANPQERGKSSGL